jgi:hypothetical protein
VGGHGWGGLYDYCFGRYDGVWEGPSISIIGSKKS